MFNWVVPIGMCGVFWEQSTDPQIKENGDKLVAPTLLKPVYIGHVQVAEKIEGVRIPEGEVQTEGFGVGY